MDGIYKEAQLIASDSTYLRPISDEYIQFYNLDINTAILTFQVMKGIYPLQIGKANSEMYVYLESENGSYITHDVENFIDPLNGIVQVNVDSDFLGAATDTWVTGQLYLKAVGRRDAVVLNEFRFYVKDALINKIDNEIKLKYIRQIDRFIEDAKKEIVEAKIGLKSLDDIQVNFDSFISEQKTELTTTIENAKTSLNNLADSTQKSVNENILKMQQESDAILEQIKSSADSVLTEEYLNTKLVDYVTFTELNERLNNAPTTSNSNEQNLTSIISEIVQQQLEESSYNNTLYDVDGTLKFIVNPDFETMDFVSTSGEYYAIAPLNTPDLEGTEGAIKVMAYPNQTKVIYWPNGKNEMYIRTQLNDSDNAWTDWFNYTSQIVVGADMDNDPIDVPSDEIVDGDNIVISDTPPEDTTKIWIDTTTATTQ